MDQNFPTIILDGDPLVREGIKLILSSTPFKPQMGDGDALEFKDLPEDRPIVFVLIVGDDTRLPQRIAAMRGRFSLARIVVLAKDSQSEFLAVAMEAGANAALLTSITPQGLVQSLHALMCEKVVVVDAKIWASAVSAKVSSENAAIESSAQTTAAPRQLSLREVEVLDRIVLGDSNKHIARHFDIAEATVKAHLKAILRKIGASNRTSAAIWAVNNKSPGGGGLPNGGFAEAVSRSH